MQMPASDITRMYHEMWDWSNMWPEWLAHEQEKLRQRQCDNSKNSNLLFSPLFFFTEFKMFA